MNKFRKKVRKHEKQMLREVMAEKVLRWWHAPKLPAELKLDEKIAVDGYGLNYRVNFLADFSLASYNKECMIKAGWECLTDNFGKEHLSKWYYGAMIFERPGNKSKVKVIFHYSLWTQGSTCKRVKIGSKIIENEEGVFEIVCNDGEAEGTFTRREL